MFNYATNTLDMYSFIVYTVYLARVGKQMATIDNMLEKERNGDLKRRTRMESLAAREWDLLFGRTQKKKIQYIYVKHVSHILCYYTHIYFALII